MLIEVKKLKKVYESKIEKLEVLRGLDLKVEEGSIVSIVGESGSGKSTLLNMIGGLDFPTGGSILIEGTDIGKLDEIELTYYRNRFFGFIFQFHYLLNDFTALENVFMPLLISGVRLTLAKRRAREYLKLVGLDGKENNFPGQLSGGERQRVAVARALITEPKIVLADEPTGNLDENNSQIVENLLFELAKTLGRTLILVTHDLELARRADVMYTLEHGVLR